MSDELRNGDIVAISCKGQVLATQVRVAKSFVSRSVGLLGTRRLPANQGLLLVPCGSVHMLGMLYSLDVLFMDAAWKVVAIKRALRPFGLALGGKKAHMTLEMPAQSLRTDLVEVGDQIQFKVS